MKMIVGLGNPGKEYAHTRHNFGFIILDAIAEMQGEKFATDKKHQAETLQTELAGDKVLLVKPQTFMNNSGQTVAALAKYYKIPDEEILVLYDDKDLNFGDTRTTGTSSAGHKGMESILDSLGTNTIARIRLGIDNGSRIPTENFVLENFTQNEFASMEPIKDRAAKEVIRWLNPDYTID